MVVTIRNLESFLNVRVARKVKEMGYSVGDVEFCECEMDEEMSGISILTEEPVKIWFIKIFGINKLVVGNLWFDNPGLQANEKSWKFRVYGKRNEKIAEEIANKLTEIFEVDIEVYTVKDEIRYERHRVSNYAY